MSLNVRRVVTGHDQDGRAVVAIDEVARNVIARRPSHQSCVVWSTGTFPSDNSDVERRRLREIASTDPHGSVFRIVEYGPGVAPRNHRTESIDYAVVMSGEIDMEVDGATVHLRARRRAGAARHRSQLDQPRQRAVCHRLRADRGTPGRAGRQDAQRSRVGRAFINWSGADQGVPDLRIAAGSSGKGEPRSRADSRSGQTTAMRPLSCGDVVGYGLFDCRGDISWTAGTSSRFSGARRLGRSSCGRSAGDVGRRLAGG